MSPATKMPERGGGPGGAGAAPSPLPAFELRPPRVGGDAYSRRVALLRRALPALGLTLLLLVAAWPRLEPLLVNVRFTFPLIDRRDARELRMIDPRYAGIDRFNRPFVLTASAGAQMPRRDDLMSLERPRGQIIVHGGAKVVLTAATGIYQAGSRLLDLFGDVTLTHSNGTRFVTQAAHLDLARETADGHDPVAGHGPSGAITSEGFRILDKGDTILFTGHAHLLLRLSVRSAAPSPPALPPPVMQAATQIAAAAASEPNKAVAKPRHPGHDRAQRADAAERDAQKPAAAESKARRHGE